MKGLPGFKKGVLASGHMKAARFADQGEKCREVSLSMTQRFADLLQAAASVLPVFSGGPRQAKLGAPKTTQT